MSGIMTVKTALATLALAIGAGFFVQYGAADLPAASSVQSNTSASSQSRGFMMAMNTNGLPVFGLPDVVTKPVDHALNVRSTVPVHAVYAEMSVPRLGTILATPITGCPVDINARRAAQAMVELTVSLPCAPNQDVLIEHAFIQFSARTDTSGEVRLDIPALVVEADFAVLINNVEYARVDIPVPAVRNYDRAVLQWRGTSNLQLHAFEDGAAIGEAGHVWSASVHDRTGFRGFVQRLGTAQAEVPYFVEVYTYPTGPDHVADNSSLQIGIALTAENCERVTDATTFQVMRGELLIRQDVSAVMPNCAAVGTNVMLEDRFSPTRQAMR